MIQQRNSRADARVQDTIKWIKSLPTIRRADIKNPIRRLTSKQYEQLLPLLRELEESGSLDFKLRYDYTRSTRQFEIRMPSAIHEGVVWVINHHFSVWLDKLQGSSNPEVSDASQTLRSHGRDVKFSFPKGPEDTEAPDGGIRHSCGLKCDDPALVFEVAWTNGSREDLKKKAEKYIIGSGGKIRTVVAIYMGEMFAAERKNEARLRKRYRAGKVDEKGQFTYPDENGQYAYEEDDENVTGSASILIWRAMTKNNRVAIGRVHETEIRDITGNTTPALLRLSLQDFVCHSLVNSVKRSKAPPLEISSEAFCNSIQMELPQYRRERAKELKKLEIKKKQATKNHEKEKERRQDEEDQLQRAREARMQDDGVIGRVVEQGRSFSARIFKRTAVKSQ